MKVKDLKKAMQRIDKFVGKDKTFARIENGWLTVIKTKTDWISVKLDVLEGLTGGFEYPGALEGVAKTWPGDLTLTSEVIGDRIKLSSAGFSTFVEVDKEMKPFGISEVTGLEDNFEYFELSEDNMALINKARRYCATEKEIQAGNATLKQTRWQAHVVISDGQLAATNGYMLFFKDIHIKSKDKILLRAEAIDAIGVNKCNLYLGEQSQVQLEGEKIRVGFKSPEVFPNWRALIVDQFNTMLSVSYKDFYEALQGCKSTGVFHFDLSVSGGQLSIRSENIETEASFERFLQDGVILSGADNKVSLNIGFIERMMKADRSEAINIDIMDGSHLIRINGHSVLMPIIVQE